jgi:hypothetical protein
MSPSDILGKKIIAMTGTDTCYVLEFEDGFAIELSTFPQEPIFMSIVKYENVKAVVDRLDMTI